MLNYISVAYIFIFKNIQLIIFYLFPILAIFSTLLVMNELFSIALIKHNLYMIYAFILHYLSKFFK